MDDALRILVVEDDQVYAEFVAETLRAAGHQVTHVLTAAGARARVDSAPFDAVLLDLALPDGSGYDVARALRAQLPPAAIILLLTATLHPERDLADAVGIDIVLSKPIDVRLVGDMVDLVRARRRRRLQPPR